MDDPDYSDYEFRPQVGEILGLLEVINIVTDTSSLRRWLEYNDDLDMAKFAPGYLVFLETGIRQFADVCENNPDIGFQSDYVSDRAIAQLPEVSAIPHDSEKLNFYRGIEDIQKQLRRIEPPSTSKTFFNEVEGVTESFRILRNRIQDDTEPADSSMEAPQLIQILASLSLYTYFQQTRKNRPKGYEPSNFDSWIDRGPRKDAIVGYTTTLQFAWSKLISPEEYVRASIDKISESSRWTTDFFAMVSEGADYSSEITLSDFRTEVESVVIDPIIDQYNEFAEIGDVYPDDLVELRSDEDLKQHFESVFSSKSARQLSELDPYDRVEYGLIWSMQAELITASVSSIYWIAEAVLRGLIQTYSTFDEEIPIHITRFNHPADEGEIVTYAILNRVPQTSLGDPSVWLIFDYFAIDSQVEGEYRVKRFEKLIDELSSSHPIHRIEVNVERDKFIKVLSDRLTDDYLKLKEANNDLQAAVETGKGAITELATVYVLSKRIDDGNVTWSQEINGEQIDVLVTSENCVRVIECKADLDPKNPHDVINQLARKVDAVDSVQRDVQPEVWVWDEPRSENISILEKFGVDVFYIQKMEEIVKASTEGLNDVFETFYPVGKHENPFNPPERPDF